MVSLLQDGPIQQVAAVLEARLLAAFPPAKFALHYVPATLTRRVWEKVTTRLPAIGLQWVALTPEANSGKTLNLVAKWNVLLLTQANSADGAKTRLLGDAMGPGIGPMATLACFALHGVTTPGLGTLMVTSADALLGEEWMGEAVAAAGVTVTLGLSLTDPLAIDNLPEFLRLNATWSFPDFSPAATDTTEVRD